MLTEEEFWAHGPVQNHIDRKAAMDGHMFETYGDDVAWVLQQPAKHVWTIVERGSDLYAVSGCSLDGIGFFVTRRPWTKKTRAILT